MRVLSNELNQFIGKKVACAGWVHAIRELGKITFIILRDRAGRMQATCKGPIAGKAGELGLEDVVWLEGTVRKDERVKGGAELEVSKIKVLSRSEKPLPIDIAEKTETNFKHRFDHRVLDLRRERQQAIFSIESTLCKAYREFLLSEGFIEVRTPKIIATGTEGGASLFPVVYFDKEAFLAQSPQFYKQMLVGAGFERVFEIAPVYRAEEHDTPFHLNEYISLDLEMGFIESELDVMNLCERLIKFMLKKVVEENQAGLELLEAGISDLKKEFPIIHYWDIPKILKKYKKEFDPLQDLSREHEQFLFDYAKKEFGSEFAFVDNYPKAKRPAYTMPYEKDSRFTRGFDLLYRGVEIVTGGQRIQDVEMLKKGFKDKGYPLDAFEFYFEVFRFGMPPHGGQAIGLERLTTQLLNLKNVREASFFPRDRKRLYP